MENALYQDILINQYIFFKYANSIINAWVLKYKYAHQILHSKVN